MFDSLFNFICIVLVGALIVGVILGAIIGGLADLLGRGGDDGPR